VARKATHEGNANLLDVIDSPIAQLAQQTERRRIARELHDSVVQSLTALVVDLEFFRTKRLGASTEANEEVVAKLEAWQELARESLNGMRQALGELRTNIGVDFDLSTSLQAFIHELQATGLVVRYECDDWPCSLPFEYASNLYYIIREAFTNIRKHAHASTITLFLFTYEGHLHVSIGDDGVGMTTVPSASLIGGQNGYHQGLIGLRERVLLLHGQLSIKSAAGKGMRIDIDVPCSWV
jgi:signal transduction histidine kinase